MQNDEFMDAGFPLDEGAKAHRNEAGINSRVKGFDVLRAKLLSQQRLKGCPAHRLEWRKVGSLHRRFRGCIEQVHSKPSPCGSEEYVSPGRLSHRANELPVATPVVRH